MNDTAPGLLPLLRLPGGHVYGPSDGEWVAIGSDGTLRDLRRAPFAFWRILECSEDEIDTLVQQSIKELGLAPAPFPPFPHVEVVIAGLRAPFEHWQSLALARVRHKRLAAAARRARQT